MEVELSILVTSASILDRAWVVACSRNTPQMKKCWIQASLIQHFPYCGYGAKAPLTANAVISVAGAASKFGKRHTRVWGRPAQQAEDCAAIPKKPGDGRSSLLESDGSWLFHWPQTALCSHLKAKLAEIAGECSPACSPAKSLCTAFFRKRVSLFLDPHLADAMAWVSSAMAAISSEAEGLPPVRLLRLLMAFCREA